MSNRGKYSSIEKRRRRNDIFRLQGGKCFWCEIDLTIDQATIDELLPRSRGGTQRWDNIVAACKPCNESRGDVMAPAWALEKVKAREAARQEFPLPIVSLSSAQESKV